MSVLGFFEKPWWSGISGAAGVLAMFGALVTVILSGLAIRSANKQARKADEKASQHLRRLDEQTARLTAALLRPEVRVVRSERAFQAIDRVKSLYSQSGQPMPDVWVALTNIGLAVAEQIDIGYTSDSDEGLPPDTFMMLTREFSFISAQSDIQVLGFKLSPDAHRMGAGYLHLQVNYKDLVGTKYRYHADLRYAVPGQPAGIQKDSTEIIDDI